MASHWSSDCELNCEVKHHQSSLAKKKKEYIKEKGEEQIISIVSVVNILTTSANTIANFFQKSSSALVAYLGCLDHLPDASTEVVGSIPSQGMY